MGLPKQQKSILSFFKTPTKPITTTPNVQDQDKIIKSSEKTPNPAGISSKEKSPVKNDATKELVESEDESKMDVSIASTTSGAEPDSPESKPEEEIAIPQRKTARKQFGGTKTFLKGPKSAEKPKSKPTRKSKSPKAINAKTSKVNNDKESGEADKKINGEISVEKPQESLHKEKTTNVSQLSSEDDDELMNKPKKRKRNVIIDDSPVKTTPSRKRRTIDSDEDEKNEEVVDNKEIAAHDSPVKQTSLKKKRTIDSDDDSNEVEVKRKPKISSKEDKKEVKKQKENKEDEKKNTKKTKSESSEDDSNEEAESTYSKKDKMTKSKDDSNEESAKTKESKKEPPKNPFSKFFAPQKKSNTEDGKKEGTEKPKDIYNPAKHNYHPIDDACWKRDEKVPYLALARTLEEIEEITARLKMIEILANFFRSVIVLTPKDLLQCVYLCLNRLAPEYEGIELGVGETLLMKAVAQATGRTVDKIKAEVSVKGDLALVAESSKGTQRLMFAFPKLTVSSVFGKFKEIAQMSGNAAMAKKTEKILAIFSACRFSEARYIIRSLGGKLRIGLAEQSVLAALAQAAVLTPPNQPYPPKVISAFPNVTSETFKKKLEKQALILKNAYCECPNYDIMIPVLLREGIAELPKHCYLSPGIPLKPMLAHPTKGVEEVLQRFDTNEFTCEYKYDGERAQIHFLDNGTVKIYSRNQEDNTTKYPDIISRLPDALDTETKSFILDTEVVAWDKENKQILPFQVLSTRKRKDASSSEIAVQVCIAAFDLLYLNGESLIRKPLKERRELMKKSFKEVDSEFMFACSLDGNSVDTMQEFLEESIKGKCEGLMVKSLVVDATYEIAKRSHNWLKLKKDYLDSVGDTLDLVVIGGWYGKGKRTGAYGGFLLACYDDETEEFQTICKIGTGFKDEDLEAHNKFLKEHVITSAKSYYRYDSGIEPDNWFEPIQVWEVKCADLSISPVHKAAVGIVDPNKGVSLRFPRFLKIRDDKKPEDATTASQVAKMYNSQEQVQDQNQNSKFDEDFY